MNYRETDPEFAERFEHFAFEEVYHVLTDWRKPVQRQTADCI